MPETPKSQWEYIYQTVPVADLPWENGEPSLDLIKLFKQKIFKKGMKVLDIGCGLGTQTLFMAQKGIVATGIDISETAVRIAHDRAIEEKVHANFIVGDATKMRFPNACFDGIYDRGCYHHLSKRQRKQYLLEAGRVLRSGGILYISVFAGAVSALEVISLFLPQFSVAASCEESFLDHTTGKYLPLHQLRFTKV